MASDKNSCLNCGLPYSFPGVRREASSCNYCLERKRLKELGKPSTEFCYTPPLKEKERMKLKNEMENYFKILRKKNCKYHGIVAYSGGKDSTASLSLLIQEYKLRILPITIDTGYDNIYMFENIKYSLPKLGISQNLIITSLKPIFAKIARYFLTKHNEPPLPGSNPTVCMVCHHIMDIVFFYFANTTKSDFIASGDDRFQTPPEMNPLLNEKGTFYKEIIGGNKFFEDLTKYWPKAMFEEVLSKKDVSLLQRLCKKRRKKPIKLLGLSWILGFEAKQNVERVLRQGIIKNNPQNLFDTNCYLKKILNYKSMMEDKFSEGEFVLSNHQWESWQNSESIKIYDELFEENFLELPQIKKVLDWLNVSKSDLLGKNL